MRVLSRTDEKIAARLALFDFRVVEELYDVEKDPDCLKNLIDDPAHQEHATRLREELEAWMVKTVDPMLEVFRRRNDPASREAYMKRVEEEAAQRGPRVKARKKDRQGARARKTES
jgi:N-sulfoglucosamine sulfohydrolase